MEGWRVEGGGPREKACRGGKFDVDTVHFLFLAT